MEDESLLLTLSSAEMQTLGKAAIDLISRRLTGLSDQPVAARWSRAELDKLLMEPIPTAPRDPLDVLSRVADEVLPACAATDHPRFFAYVPGPGNFVAAIADFIAAGANVFAGHWLVGAGAAEVELVVLEWLRELMKLPKTSGGLLTNGGTSASLIAIHAARHRRFGGPSSKAVIYVSDQTHASVVRGLEYIGFDSGQLHRVPAATNLVMDVERLKEAVTADLARGAVPFCVIATAGTTSTGAVDPLPAIADVCAGNDLWLHVDAAYGGAAVLLEDGDRLLDGLPRADSIAIDPHKWWFQPYEAGCLLVRDAEALRAAYSLHAGYLTETLAADPVNFYDYGPQLTRGFRALKVWMTIQVFGLDAMRVAVGHGVQMAEYAESLLRTEAQWAVVTAAQLGIVTFRPMMPGVERSEIDGVVRDLAEEMLNNGHALVLTTDWGDGPVLRLCTTHPRTTKRDVESTLALLGDMLRTRVGRLRHD